MVCRAARDAHLGGKRGAECREAIRQLIGLRSRLAAAEDTPADARGDETGRAEHKRR
jgi:hypothetical protein